MKNSKVNVSRISIILLITAIMILVINKTGIYSDQFIMRFQSILVICAAVVFCVFNNSNKQAVCIKNMGIFMCAMVAYVYSYEMNFFKYIIYIAATMFVIVMTIFIDKKVDIKNICGQIFYIVRIILLPTMFQALNGINENGRILICVVVVVLYSRVYDKVFCVQVNEN